MCACVAGYSMRTLVPHLQTLLDAGLPDAASAYLEACRAEGLLSQHDGGARSLGTPYRSFLEDLSRDAASPSPSPRGGSIAPTDAAAASWKTPAGGGGEGGGWGAGGGGEAGGGQLPLERHLAAVLQQL
eukprot:354736-Chlamydomonas_euryale.AAC.5